MLVALPVPPQVGSLTADVRGGTVQRIVFGLASDARASDVRASDVRASEAPVSDAGSGVTAQNTSGVSGTSGASGAATDHDFEVAARLGTEVEAYFAGRLQSFSLPLDLSARGDFSERVYRQLLTVGFGHTVTYGQLAAMAGQPRAARAVGSAMAKNRWPLLVPCHRVVPTSGAPGHFAGGTSVKAFLLDFEARLASRA